MGCITCLLTLKKKKTKKGLACRGQPLLWNKHPGPSRPTHLTYFYFYSSSWNFNLDP